MKESTFKKKIILICFNKFLSKFDLDRYEIQYLKKNFIVEIHELINFVHPGLDDKYYYISKENKKVFIDFSEWKRELYLLDKNKTILIFQTFPYNLKSFYLYCFIKIKFYKVAIISTYNLPTYNLEKVKINFSIILSKIKSLILNPKKIIGQSIKKIIMIFFYFFDILLSPDYHLVCGKKKSYFRYSKTIRINSWEYSKFLRDKCKYKIKHDYIIYISDGEGVYPSDSTTYNTKRVENINEYSKELNKFFGIVEKFYKTKIIIAAHPRSDPHIRYNKRLGSRKNVYGNTYNLIKNSKFVISVGSTSLAYAVFFKKPILFIFSDYQKRNISGMRFTNFFSKILHSERINISTYFKLSKLDKVNFTKYQKFKKNYHLMNKYLPNYKIISKYLH
jgi:hypothetical protein